jgi:murein DD-endopeptidase MepM/ murein hydrolase activator NlpD
MRAARLTALLLALAGLGAAASPPAPSPSPSEAAGAAADRQLLTDVRGRLSGELASALAVQMQLSRALQANTGEQVAAGRDLAVTGTRLAALDDSIAARQTQMDLTLARVEAERRQIAALARALYRQPGSLLERMARAGSLGDALTGVADMEAAARRGRELKADLDRRLAELRAAQEEQTAERRQQVEVRAAQQRTLDGLRQLGTGEERAGATLTASIRRTQAALVQIGGPPGGLTARVLHELDAEQASVSAAAQQEAWSQVAIGLRGGVPGEAPGSPGHSQRTRLIWPLPAASVSQIFGPTDLAFEPAYGGYAHFHTGIDLVEPLGSAVLAADDGVVAVVAGGSTGYGNYVVVAHAGGLTTLYGHLLAASVSPGQRVAQGQPVGLEGSTGNSTGPHLHFEVRVAGVPLDPTPFLPPGAPSASRA